MWNDSIRAWRARNNRLIQGFFATVGILMLLINIGGVLAGYPDVFSKAEMLLLTLAISLLGGIFFVLLTTRSTPRYPQTPLEFHQQEFERAIVKEWGGSIGWLRETTASAEECSEAVIQLHKDCLEGGKEPTSKQIALLAMHNKLCDLSRAVADLCQRGHAEAALMLWRSIFEIEINMQFISQDETDSLAERFIDWGRAAYLRLNHPDSAELGELRRKYPKPNQLDNERGWTRTHESKPMGVPGRAEAVGYGEERVGLAALELKMYKESNSYVHNDSIAIANYLGKNHPLQKGPSESGHDMPLYLTASSVSTANEALIGSLDEADKEGLRNVARVVRVRRSLLHHDFSPAPERLSEPIADAAPPLYHASEVFEGDASSIVLMILTVACRPSAKMRHQKG